MEENEVEKRGPPVRSKVVGEVDWLSRLSSGVEVCVEVGVEVGVEVKKEKGIFSVTLFIPIENEK